MSDIQYKTTFTADEIMQKKTAYLEAKKILTSYLREVAQIIEDSGETPITGENRKMLMDKFSMIDHRLWDKFDVASFEYFEANENQEA
ncbi:hypothetical protein KA111_00345 [Candidatus Woesebacteria bacterium]|nr:hypothetical protein [Candidatus Woesebacteria bacterium]